ncbi:hypothetical protein CHLRE_07g315350v5 [Chlamydomonas reinhardtii]|uniref:Rab-GAP TBC domain-containing protein n=1 Tax=Chlamydomonas reinhardtii TaxID=3055 RepID=A0A2K3DIN4_CHLRE|nr:uncharacterized protein CHLRE_07g315350v5 [Chlamydomonas reinhardtii]PNW80386.1 hypothetical protein CHLRE_07g315350v5 [Chlamydomonas reinhardtii]
MEHLSKAFAAVSRTVQSASELLRDKELRDKGIQTVISGAQSRLQGLQNGIVQRAGRIGERLQDRQRQLASLLASLEERLYSSQRTWQLQASRRQRVDVQLGRSLFTDAPQEVRARLWYVLLENPNLAAPIKCQHPGPVPNRPSVYDDDDDDDSASTTLAVSAREASTRSTATGVNDRVSVAPGASGGINTGVARAAGAAAAAAAAADADGGLAPSSSSSSLAAVAAAALGFGRSTSTASTNSPSVVRKTSNNNDGGVGVGGSAASVTGTPPPTRLRTGTGAAESSAGGNDSTVIPCAAGAPSTPAPSAVSAPTAAAAFDVDGWELVGGAAGLGSFETAGLGMGGLGLGGGSGIGSGPSAGAMAMAVPEAVRIITERLEALGPLPLDESQGSDPVAVAQQAVLEAMLQVPWEAGEGLPADVAPDSRFAMLNEMTAGQEEVDDSILRDIHRTFPEHPYFGLEAGQRSLFRVLKAYSLHDLEVAYCQGMAFMAGVLLMYVPEEMAFRLFCRLMDGEGPNLRRLYLPGLEPLKAELATFELLLSWRLPELGAHLSEFGLPPVLYVSQWLMTVFATPFPPPFCARVIDVLLQDGNDRLLLRCSYAVMEALEPELLARHDFQALITYLKMEPVSWGLGRQRAIFESALASPITDAEIEVARDTVASRHLLAAALGGSGAAGAGSGMAGGGGAGGAGSAFGGAAGGVHGGGGGSGADELAASSAPGPLAQLLAGQDSFKKEVDAALAMAAAAGAGAGAEGGAGSSRDGAGGAAGPSGAGGGAAAAGATARGHGRGGDMIAMEDEGDEAPAPGSAAAAAAAAGIAGLGIGALGAAEASAGGQRSGHGIGHGHGHSLSGGRSSAIDAGPGAPGSHPHPHSRHRTSPPAPDVMDEPLAVGGGGGGVVSAAEAAAALGQPPAVAAAGLFDDPLLDGLGLLQPHPAPELDGEYGEMLMDAGLLLPEVGTDMAAVANAAGGGGAGGFGLLDSLGLGGDTAIQRPAGGNGGGAGDLLLD